MDVKEKAGTGAVLFELTTANGGIASTDLPNGWVTFNIDQTDLSSLTAGATYVADIIRLTGGDRLFFAKVTINILEGVTQP